MSRSTLSPRHLLEQMAPAAHQRFGNDARWAAACGLPRETLSRLRKRDSCELRTLASLASVAGFSLVAAPGREEARFGREEEEALLKLCASGNRDARVWLAQGPAFFMGAVAVMLASARGFDRRRYLELAENLHRGISVPEVFDLWLRQSPLRPGRFLPMLERRKTREAA